jgi:phytoene synthase
MSTGLLDLLPPPQRLALAYSPASTREHLLALLAFDARLGMAIRQANEPIMAQMRLAWWRDQLRLEAEQRERSDELVVALDRLAGMRGALFSLIDGWEGILGEFLDNHAIGGLATARGRALAAVARLAGVSETMEAVEKAGTRWALGDLAAGLSDGAERNLTLGLARELGNERIALPRELRTLAVLDGLARRSLSRGGGPLFSGPASGLLAIRLGLTGR